MTPDAGTPRREGEIREILDELRRNQAEEKEKAAIEAERKIQALKEEQQRILYEQKVIAEKHAAELRAAKEAAISHIYCYCSSAGCVSGRGCKCSAALDREPKGCASRCGCRGNASVCQNPHTAGVKEYRAKLKAFAAQHAADEAVAASPAPALASASSSPMKPLTQMSKLEVEQYLAYLNSKESVHTQSHNARAQSVRFLFIF